ELSQEGPFTLFCPRNQAMELIRPEAWEKLWDEERNKFFRHHVAARQRDSVFLGLGVGWSG
ncbi:unnamed protein product, partial [Effrenium voratum]